MTQTSQEHLLLSIASLLNKNNFPYMLTGAWSVIYYARPRASHDIDLVVELGKKDLSRIEKAFKELSPEFLIQADPIKEAIHKKDMFNIIHLPTTLKIDFWLLKDDLFDKQRFARRKKIKLFNQIMWITTAEDTILKKLDWYKKSKLEKHLIDAAFVYQVQRKNLDKVYLNKWVKELKLTGLFKELPKIDLEEHM
ncbi:hypothetical protein A2955_00205 [Candidatus Woesebacteria bacterium RIFCSPLOWO2_01_FULL_37_19]|uniref:Uncharacterized protein n=1 Tax=Candidatus Woesebacteria bacterium RIFCSPLOWO2_01_FULL_37_19 TaxID=1802514 RepID=A0A1F8BAW0_9BACT|nr:MAG: hypothetical protein A2955_00205 [Candidatus Woesebacteria bacterium RIFCSPLOWO2_01_FULL_37_19]